MRTEDFNLTQNCWYCGDCHTFVYPSPCGPPRSDLQRWDVGERCNLPTLELDNSQLPGRCATPPVVPPPFE